MKTRLLHLLTVYLALASAVFSAAFAADLPRSQTNSIHGVVRFSNADPAIRARLGPPGNEGMVELAVLADSAPPDSLRAVKHFNNVDKSSVPYVLTVATDDLPLIYDVFAVLTLDGGYEEYLTQTRATTPITSNSPPATVDFNECIAMLELRYVDAAGQPVLSLGGRGVVTETANSALRARYLTQPAGRTGNFLVVPSGVEVQIVIEVDTGTNLYLDRLTHSETHIMTLACDSKPVLTITIPDAVKLGRIVGNVNMVACVRLRHWF